MNRIVAVVAAIILSGCAYSNLDDVKAHAEKTWRSVGYEVVGYEGYQWSWYVGGPYGGANVWYTLRRKEAPGIIYTGYLYRWGDEYHVYSVKAVDAIKPR